MSRESRSRLGVAIDRMIPATNPSSQAVQVGRSLIALATALTLAVNSGETLFHSSDPATPATAMCSGVTRIGLFCAIPDPNIARWVGFAVLALVLAGLYPPVLSIVHWYVTASVFWTITPMEGGDQLATIVTLFLIPLGICERRLCAWRGQPKQDANWMNCVGFVALIMICLQLVVVYANSAIAKFSSPPWVEGSALWYWMQHPAFGAPQWLQGPALDVLATPVGTAAFTWGPMILELFVAVSLLVSWRGVRLAGWVAGVVFHLGIAVVIGLVSFALVMIGVLTIALIAFPPPAAATREFTSDTPSDEEDAAPSEGGESMTESESELVASPTNGGALAVD